MTPTSDYMCFIYIAVVYVKLSAHLNPRAPDVTSGKEVKSSPKKNRGCVCFYVCVLAVWDTCCFNRRCADVTAEAKKPPLKRKGFGKRARKGLICLH